MAKVSTRNKKKPNRYGNSESSFPTHEEEEEAFTDNSMDDPDFVLEKSSNSVSSDGEPSRKKTKIDASSKAQNKNITFEKNNFDDEFDSIRQTLHENSQLTVSPSGQSTNNIVDSLDGAFIRQQLLKLNTNTEQILARITVIEESLMRNGALITVNTNAKRQKALEEFQSFSKLNKLPLKCIEDVKKFESNLLDSEFKSKAESSFVNFPSMDQLTGNKPKLLKGVVFNLFSPACLAGFTWTGKASAGQSRKNALRDYSNILQMLHSIMCQLDGEYEHSVFLNHLKNKVIKYAYENAGNSVKSEEDLDSNTENVTKEIPSAGDSMTSQNSKRGGCTLPSVERNASGKLEQQSIDDERSNLHHNNSESDVEIMRTPSDSNERNQFNGLEQQPIRANRSNLHLNYSDSTSDVHLIRTPTSYGRIRVHISDRPERSIGVPHAQRARDENFHSKRDYNYNMNTYYSRQPYEKATTVTSNSNSQSWFGDPATSILYGDTFELQDTSTIRKTTSTTAGHISSLLNRIETNALANSSNIPTNHLPEELQQNSQDNLTNIIHTGSSNVRKKFEFKPYC